MRDLRRLRPGLVWLAIFVCLAGFWLFVARSGNDPLHKDISYVVAEIKDGKVRQLTQTENSREVKVEYADMTAPDAETRIPANTDLYGIFEANGVTPAQMQKVQLEITPAGRMGAVLPILGFLLPTLFLIGIFVFMMRQSQGSNSQAMAFGKSKARLFTGNRPTITFADVAGVDEAKEELVEVVEFLKYPEKFQALGARIPSGVLLVGPPGTGKTLLSRAVAGEAGVPFFSISGSEFVEMFVGVGASRVRDLFEQAKKAAPCIVFVDEIDAVGRQRGSGLGGSHDEREQTLNQILVEMDGFDSSTNVIIIAATNRPDVLDPALLRPGRFDRQVLLDRPDIQGRMAILDVHARGKPFEPNVSTENLARQTPGFSGADLENLVNEAAILAARRNKRVIGRSELTEAIDRVVAGPQRKSRVISERERSVEAIRAARRNKQVIGRSELTEAIDRVVAGPQRKSRVISERERLMTAYHEAGHALVARMLPNADPVRKVSIVARGMAGGYTRVVPDEDRMFKTKKQFEDDLAVFMAGQVAESMVFDELSTGASNDLERATGMARRMVTEFGMSERLGPLALGKKDDLIFLGRGMSDQRNYSDEIAYLIDQEIRKLVELAHERARELITAHFDKLELIATMLIERETIEGEELEELFDGPRPKPLLVGPPTSSPALRQRLDSAESGRPQREFPVGRHLRPHPAD